MPSITENTLITLPARQLLIFSAGGAGNAQVSGITGGPLSYVVGLYESYVGPYDRETSVYVTGSVWPIVYTIDTDGVLPTLPDLATRVSAIESAGADSGSTTNDWPADDTLGVWNGGLYWPVCKRLVLSGNVYGASGSTLPSGQDIEICPENDDALSPDQPIELAAFEGNVWQQATTTGADIWMGGRYNRVPAAYQGPYGTSARPVVVP